VPLDLVDEIRSGIFRPLWIVAELGLADEEEIALVVGDSTGPGAVACRAPW
jgi:hypothetical protein